MSDITQPGNPRLGFATHRVGLALFLVAYGNLATALLGSVAISGGWPGVASAFLLISLVSLWAWRGLRLSPAEVGLTWRGAGWSAAVGLVVGVGGGLAAFAFLRLPGLPGGPVTYAPLGSLSPDALLLRAFVWMPLDTALPEEIAFRGVLLAALRRQFSDRRAIVLSSGVFVFWHGVVVTRTILLTNLADEPVLLVLGLAGAFFAILVGGVLFAALRVRTGHLAGSIVAHWLFNATLLVGLGVLATGR